MNERSTTVLLMCLLTFLVGLAYAFGGDPGYRADRTQGCALQGLVYDHNVDDCVGVGRVR